MHPFPAGHVVRFRQPIDRLRVAGALLCGFSGGGSGPKRHYVMCGELTLDYRGLRIQSLTRRGAARALPHSICAIDRSRDTKQPWRQRSRPPVCRVPLGAPKGR
jgi:hypothetical protein